MGEGAAGRTARVRPIERMRAEGGHASWTARFNRCARPGTSIKLWNVASGPALTTLALGNLLTINRDIVGCIDPNPNRIAFHGQHDNFDIIADAHYFVYFAHQHQHQSCSTEMLTIETTL